jgi:hypothetical protein
VYLVDSTGLEDGEDDEFQFQRERETVDGCRVGIIGRHVDHPGAVRTPSVIFYFLQGGVP